MKTLGVRLSDDEHAELFAEAKRNGRSMGATIRLALQKAGVINSEAVRHTLVDAHAAAPEGVYPQMPPREYTTTNPKLKEFADSLDYVSMELWIGLAAVLTREAGIQDPEELLTWTDLMLWSGRKKDPEVLEKQLQQRLDGIKNHDTVLEMMMDAFGKNRKLRQDIYAARHPVVYSRVGTYPLDFGSRR